MTPKPSPDALVAAVALSLLPGVGAIRWRRLVATHGTPAGALEATLTDPASSAHGAVALKRARALVAGCAERGIALSVPGDDEYPVRLLALEDPPVPLFSMQRASAGSGQANARSVALVGARRASSAGRHAAWRFAAALAREGVTVVSGLAAGVDAAAHEGALSANGHTIAVLGTGVDVPYPRSNTALHAAVARDGVLYSESPPGAPAYPGAFPRRNRIIAALAEVVVVVEAGIRSGGLITAQVAESLGRMVAAVPGPIGSEHCLGSNTLLRDGGHVVLAPEDVLAMLSLTSKDESSVRALGGPAAPADAYLADSAEHRVLAVLDAGPHFADDLVRVAGAGAREIGTALSMLTIAGLVSVDASGLVYRR